MKTMTGQQVLQDMAEQMLDRPYWIVDILPCRVPAGSPGRYFAVEEYFLQEPRLTELHRRYLDLLLKLNCYCDLCVSRDLGESWTENPDPGLLETWILGMGGSGTVHVFIRPGQALAVLNADDTYMTVYSPDPELLELLRALAGAEGLFVWQP